jgi:protein NDRG1
MQEQGVTTHSSFEEWIQGNMLVTRITKESERSGKYPLFCFPEIGTSCELCYDLFFDHEETSFMKQVFCIYYVEFIPLLPSAESLETSFSFDQCVEDLEQIITRMNLGYPVHGIGTGMGGYFLTLFAVKHKELIASMILINTSIEAASWTEYLYTSFRDLKMAYMGIESRVSSLLKMYFSSEFLKFEEYICLDFKEYIEKLNQNNLFKALQSYVKRRDLREDVKKLHCPLLIFIGENTQNFDELLRNQSTFNLTSTSWIKVKNCGDIMTREKPGEMIMSLKLFLQSMDFLLDMRVEASQDLSLRII